MKIRFLSVAAVCAVGALVLTGCDSKVGTAAEVNGHKISESDLNSYLTPNAQPIQVSQSASVSARTFVLETLLDNELLRDAVQAKGKPTDDNALASVRETALAGTTDDAIDKQADATGLSRKFTGAFVSGLELKALVANAYKTDQAGLTAAIGKIKVKVNPRFGSWDAKAASLTDLSRTQLPAFLQFDNALPGDTPPAS